MLIWMLFSTALGGALVVAAMLVEPLARLGHLRTRFLWLIVVLAIIGWSAVLAVGAPRAASSDVDVRDGSAIGAVATPAEAGNVTASVGIALSSGIVRTLIRPNIHVDVVLVALWLLGSLACIATLVFSAWRIARMRRSWSPRVIAGIPVLVSHDIGPAVVGVVHHGIVVPAWIESLDDASRRLVMLHEREHVRAGDPLLLWGTTLLVSLMPWNAALWFALRRTRHAIEIDCDARVLRLEADPRPYCSLLIEVGGRTLTGVAPAAALAEPATLLERRVTAMLRSRRLGFREIAGGLLGVGLIAVACRTPTPPGFAGIGVPQLARELNARLATESGRAALSSGDRLRLGEALGFIPDARQPVTVPSLSLARAIESQLPASPLADSVVRQAVAKHFPGALAGRLGHHPYLWFAADSADTVLRSASGRSGLRAEMGHVNLVTWEGAASMLSGVPASAHPGDELYFKLLSASRDTIGVVWVRLRAGLPPR